MRRRASRTLHVVVAGAASLAALVHPCLGMAISHPVGLASAGSVATTGVAPPADLVERLDAWLRPYVAAGHISGTLLVAHQDSVLYERSFGLANYELGVANTPETRFCVASITKPMTIAIVCRLAEAGKVLPADPVSKYLPDFPRGDEITVSHLLNHRAGIPHRVTEPENESVSRTAADMVALVAKRELLFPPGERSEYSSAGFSVLARILEIAGERSYAQLLQDEVCAPAGMTRTLHAGARELVPDRARSAWLVPGGLENGMPRDLSFLVGAGSVLSTPRDLHRLMRAVLDGRLGTAAQIALVRENGFRWNGTTDGYHAFADYYAETGIAVIFTGNVMSGAIDRLRKDAPRIAAGEVLPEQEVPQVAPASLPDSALARLEGDYATPGGGSRFALRVERGLVRAGDRVLIPVGETTFYSPADYRQVRIIGGSTGGKWRLEWETDGQPLVWERVADGAR